MIEVWKRIINFTDYAISNHGRIMSFKRSPLGTFMSPSKNTSGTGYYYVTLSDKNKIRKDVSVHRLVAKHFVEGMCESLVVDHIDGNTSNNNCNNLQWISQQKNVEKGKVAQRNVELNSKNYIVTYPNGREVLVTNLTQFSRDNNLVPQHLSRVVHGIRKHCKGFKARSTV